MNPNVGENESDEEKREYIETVECPVCHKETFVPNETWKDGLVGFSNALTKGMTVAYYTVRQECFVKCPNCKYPVKVEKGDSISLSVDNDDDFMDEPMHVICKKCDIPFEATR